MKFLSAVIAFAAADNHTDGDNAINGTSDHEFTLWDTYEDMQTYITDDHSHPVNEEAFTLNEDFEVSLEHCTEAFLEIAVSGADGEVVWEDITAADLNYELAFQILGQVTVAEDGLTYVLAELPLTSNEDEAHTILISDQGACGTETVGELADVSDCTYYTTLTVTDVGQDNVTEMQEAEEEEEEAEEDDGDGPDGPDGDEEDDGEGPDGEDDDGPNGPDDDDDEEEDVEDDEDEEDEEDDEDEEDEEESESSGPNLVLIGTGVVVVGAAAYYFLIM